jgi:cytochrome c oxidase cbb3-type subunit 3
LLVATVAGCQDGRGPTREWQASDHDTPSGPNQQQVAAASARAPAGAVDPSLVELSWQQRCMTCHGSRGRGDGPTGPMVGAPDLTRDDFLSRVKDEEIAAVIREGRGRMPAFDLPPSVVDGLVQRIRARGAPLR